MKSPVVEGVAITGMACRFPGAPSVQEFWDLLCDGKHSIGPIPADRWNAEAQFDEDLKAPGKSNARYGGFIDDIARFDAAFFGISRREAAQMDPQQRILLELTYEALEDAGIAPPSLAGSDTSVSVGAMTNDYIRLQLQESYRNIDVHTASGAGLCMLANRLSYQFDLRGPSISIDTACSSSLVAVFNACQSLWVRQSRVAIAAGVNIMLDGAFNVFYTKAGLSAPDGRCKTFSAAANGIGRAEGAGVVVLKRLRDALADGDRIYAVIRGGAVNHDGRSNGLTQPNRWAQEQLLRTAYEHAGVDHRELGYIELHGTGTLIGDPIEANALGAVLLEDDQRDGACLVGSVKTNFGHLEAAAGIAGMMKLALSIAYSAIPPSLWFDQPNPHIAFDRLPLKVNTELTSWNGLKRRRVGGVSSFGLGGTNAHLVLESVPAVNADSASIAPRDANQYCLLLSARSQAALQSLATSYIEFLSKIEERELPTVCSSSLRRKGIHDFRLSIIGNNCKAMSESLHAFVAGNPHNNVRSGRYRRSSRGVLLVAPDCRRIEMARIAAWVALPIARDAWNSCRATLHAVCGVSLPSALALPFCADISADEAVFRAWHFAAQFSILKQLSEGIESVEAVVADGMGQLAAICATGAISLDVAAHWLVENLSDTFLKKSTPKELPYAVACDCNGVRNPALMTIDWNLPAQPWRERVNVLLGERDADVMLLNLDAAPESQELAAGRSSLLCLGDKPDNMLRSFAGLVLAHSLRWKDWNDDYGFVRLPSYPWQRETFWISRQSDPVAEQRNLSALSTATTTTTVDRTSLAIHVAANVHELLGTRVDAPTNYWQNRLIASGLPYLPDHRVQGLMVLPGSAYVELGLAVHHDIGGVSPAVLEDLEFHKALVVQEQDPPSLHTLYDAQRGEFTVYSQQKSGTQWELNARGKLSLSPPPVAPPMDIEELKRRCTSSLDGPAHYDDMRSRGFGYGPYFQGVRKLWVDASGEHVLAWVEAHQELQQQAHHNHLHPTLFDAAMQSLLTLLSVRGNDELYIPIGIRQLTLHRTAPNGFWCYGSLRQESPEVVEGSAVLLDEDGRVIADVSGVRAQALTRKQNDDFRQQDQWLYEFAWENQPLVSTPRYGGRWLVFMDQSSDVTSLIEYFLDAGAREVIRVFVSTAYEQIDASTFMIDSGSREDMQRLIDAVAKDGDLAGAIYLLGINAAGEASGLVDKDLRIVPLVHLLQTAEGRHERGQEAGPSNIVVVTCGAQPITNGRPVSGMIQGALIGLVRVAINEFPTLRIRTIDIDHDALSISALAREILTDSAEDELALREKQRLVRRMRRKTAGDFAAAAAAAESESGMGADGNRSGRFNKNGTYLITGGFGGFGLQIAEWLVKQGAGYLVLVGRQGAHTPAAKQSVDKLRRSGAQVLPVAADVANESDVKRLLAEISGELPPLKGVFHAAAVLDDAPINRLDATQIDNSMRPKALGAWHLHRHTLTAQLDHFVLFSSVASMVGGPGQAAYVMACAYLDSLAHYRRDRNLPAISIHWGALADVGMTTRHSDAAKVLGSSGVGMFTPLQAVNMLGQALQWNPAEVVIAKMDWTRWQNAYPRWGASPKYSELLTAETAVSNLAKDSELLQRLKDLTPSARQQPIVAELAKLLAPILDTDAEQIDIDMALPSMGLDSLMAMDFQIAVENSMTIKVPMLELMKGNSLMQLAAQIAVGIDELAATQTEREPARRVLPDEFDIEDAERFIADIDQLADDEVDRLLAKLQHGVEAEA